MNYTSLESFIEAARAIGDVKDVHGAALDVEVGTLSELAAESDGPLAGRRRWIRTGRVVSVKSVSPWEKTWSIACARRRCRAAL